MSVAVFIPIFNASNAIQEVVKDLTAIEWPKHTKLIFIDNCSSDNTIVELMGALSGFNASRYSIFKNSKNVGLGGSQKNAFRFAIENNFEFVAIFHGDFQPTAFDLKRGIELIQDLQMDALLGSRFHRQSVRVRYNRVRLLGNLILNFLYSVRFRTRVYDLGSGLNIYKVSSLPSFENLPNDLSFNCHLLASQIRTEVKLQWLPITWREGLAPSSLKAINLGIASLKPLFRKKNAHNPILSSMVNLSKDE
jgi:glycosyltransferase involved in cell wall biosynthesis